MQSVTPSPADKPLGDPVAAPANVLLKAATPMHTSLRSFILDTSVLFNETIKASPERKSSVAGPKPYAMGNSGATLFDTVYKCKFPEVRAEAEHLLHLGPHVAPRIFAMSSIGYCMEKLVPAPWTPDLPKRVAELLQFEVWRRPPVKNSMDWLPKLEQMLNITVPDWAIPEKQCLCHGDPAMGNVLMRRDQLVIGDAAPRAYLPECEAVDQGKILQSVLGWESVAYGVEAPRWELFPLWDFGKRAAFWCLISVMRIQYRERRALSPRPQVEHWCKCIIEGLRNELGV